MSKRLASPEEERRAIDLFEAALDQDAGEQREFIQSSAGHSTAVRDRALALLKRAEEDEQSFVTGRAGLDFRDEDETLPERIGAYRILRLIGRGGMGNVYLAERASDDFDHVAAIKVVKQGLFNEENGARFRRERQVLAQLNHPHIAQLYDGGDVESGAPYIVMEYIDGRPLHRWLEEDRPPRTLRLKVFCEVCEAVSFAHQNLVIHRDLTPANVLINGEDRAKLIDFGIARPSTSDDARGEDSSGFTPGFAAPEQVAQGWGNVLSDVFSLGKLLDLMLAGMKDREISAIVSKAAHADPDKRYQSVAAMLGDIRAYLTGYPISVLQGSTLYTVRKFASRQKALVGASAILGAALVTALIGLAIAYNAQLAAETRAAERAAETRQIATSMMFGVYDEVARVPGSTNARLLLADTAQRYLRSLASDPDASIEARIEAASGFRRLARIVGGAQTNAVADIGTGIDYLEEARAILEAARELAPDDPRVARELAQTLASLAGEKILSLGDTDGALADAEEAIALLESNLPLGQEDAAALVLAYRFKAEALGWANDMDASKLAFDAGIAATDGFAQSLRTSSPVRRAEAEFLIAFAGFTAQSSGEPSSAIGYFEQSVALRRAVIEQEGDAPDDVYKLVIALYYLGEIERMTQQPDDARRHAQEALNLAQQQRDLNPASATQDSLFAGILMLNALIDSAAGRSEDAARNARQSVDLMRASAMRNPDVASYRMNLAVRLHQAGIVYDTVGQRRNACAAMREGFDLMDAYDREAGLPPGNRTGNYEPMQAYLTTC